MTNPKRGRLHASLAKGPKGLSPKPQNCRTPAKLEAFQRPWSVRLAFEPGSFEAGFGVGPFIPPPFNYERSAPPTSSS